MKVQASYADLAGRRVLVTGASSGIGLGIAEAMLGQGMEVAVHYRTGKQAAVGLCGRFPGKAVALDADLASEEGCTALVRRAANALGGLDALIHSAGTWSDGPIDRIGREAIEAVFRVNTFSAFYLVREALPFLRSGTRGRGNVIFIGSTAGQRGEAGHGHYAASKGALQSLAMSLAVELAPAVRVNLVSPGWVRTPMAEAAVASARGQRIAGALPNRRIGEVEDVAHAVLYLSSEASGHLVGQDLGVSGGALLVVPRGQIAQVE